MNKTSGTHRHRYVGVLECGADEVSPSARDMCVLRADSQHVDRGSLASLRHTCLPNTIWRVPRVRTRRKREGGVRTYHELAFALQVATPYASERVVVLAFAERGGVDVGREEADGGEDPLVEGGLVGVGDMIVFFMFRLLWPTEYAYVP